MSARAPLGYPFCGDCKRSIEGQASYLCQTCSPPFFLCDSCLATSRNTRFSHATQHVFARPPPPRSGAVHQANCDECSSEIVGNRYKCLRCADYDACERCFAAPAGAVARHRVTHAFVRLASQADLLDPTGPVPARLQHASIHCDGARCRAAAGAAANTTAAPVIAGTMYMCEVCPDFFLCEACELAPDSGHDPRHVVHKYRFPMSAADLQRHTVRKLQGQLGAGAGAAGVATVPAAPTVVPVVVGGAPPATEAQVMNKIFETGGMAVIQGMMQGMNPFPFT